MSNEEKLKKILSIAFDSSSNNVKGSTIDRARNIQGFLNGISNKISKDRLDAIAAEKIPFDPNNSNKKDTDIKNMNKEVKPESLYDYIIHVYCGRKSYISYKDISNINEEVKKIYRSIYQEEAPADITGQEFLSINDALPGMVNSDKVANYSALLNGNDENAEKFKKFLKELRRRTINYN